MYRMDTAHRTKGEGRLKGRKGKEARRAKRSRKTEAVEEEEEKEERWKKRDSRWRDALCLHMFGLFRRRGGWFRWAPFRSFAMGHKDVAQTFHFSLCQLSQGKRGALCWDSQQSMLYPYKVFAGRSILSACLVIRDRLSPFPRSMGRWQGGIRMKRDE